MKKILVTIIVILTCFYGQSQLIEANTSIVNGLIIKEKPTAAIQALTIAPNGYLQYSLDTETLWLKKPGGWFNTGSDQYSLSVANQSLGGDNRIIEISSGSIDFQQFAGSVLFIDNNQVSIAAMPDEAYSATNWNGATDPPTKNAIRDKIESLGDGSQNLSEVLTQGNDAGGLKIANLADPTLAQDAATKDYVDDNLTGGGIVAEGVFTILGGSTTYTITHSLGYVPVIQRIQIQRASSFIGSSASDYITNVTSSSFDLVVASTSTTGDYAWRIFGTGLLVGQVDTDDQILSLGGTGNKSLTIEDGNTIALPVLANADQSVPTSGTRTITAGTSASLKLNDGSGRTWFDVTSNSVQQAEGNGYIGENITFREHSGTDDDIINLNFDFDTGTDRTLIATPSDITYNGTSLLGGGSSTALATTYDNTASGLLATNVKEALDEINIKTEDNASSLGTISGNVTDIGNRQDSIVTILGTPTKSLFDFQTKTAPYTLVADDARDNRVILLDYSDENVTVPSGVFAQGEAIRFQNNGTGKANIVPGSGVSFGLKDGYTLPAPTATDTIVKAVTISRITSATGPEIWTAIDGYTQNYLDILPAPLASNANPELITTAFAFTPLAIATAPSGGTNDNQISPVLSPTFSIVDALPNDYGVEKALRVGSTTSTNDRQNYYIGGLTIGQTYEVAVLHRKVTGNGSTRLRMVSAESNVTFDFQTTSTDWQLGTGTFIPTATKVRMEIYGNFGGATDAGTADYIATVKLQD